MFKHAEHVLEEALELPAEDRLRLADRLIESVPEGEIMHAWLDEVEHRQAEFDAGTVKGHTLEEVVSEARARLAE